MDLEITRDFIKFLPNKAEDTLRKTIPLFLTADKNERGFTPTWTRIRVPIIQKA